MSWKKFTQISLGHFYTNNNDYTSRIQIALLRSAWLLLFTKEMGLEYCFERADGVTVSNVLRE